MPNHLVNTSKAVLIAFTTLYMMGGTLSMGIVYHQHKGHIMGWLAGDEKQVVRTVTLERTASVQQDECQKYYGITCEQYQIAIGQAKKLALGGK